GVAPSARHDHERRVIGFPRGPRQYALAGVPAAVELDVLRHGASFRYQFLNGGGEDTNISGSGVLSQRPPPSRLPRPAALLSLTVESRFSAGSLVRNSLGDLSRNRSFR